ncbi:hypothetical protein PIB30_052802 [Stylosanthes scabra]|uniref:Uncharacterized protein n=1 Tax=Stylosanthes scabra TaxID=79078 RepID=A0ABU6VH73_9FABA|nr:hypothetical protein [Stylosanthes scabra]
MNHHELLLYWRKLVLLKGVHFVMMSNSNRQHIKSCIDNLMNRVKDVPLSLMWQMAKLHALDDLRFPETSQFEVCCNVCFRRSNGFRTCAMND